VAHAGALRSGGQGHPRSIDSQRVLGHRSVPAGTEQIDSGAQMACRRLRSRLVPGSVMCSRCSEAVRERREGGVRGVPRPYARLVYSEDAPDTRLTGKAHRVTVQATCRERFQKADLDLRRLVEMFRPVDDRCPAEGAAPSRRRQSATRDRLASPRPSRSHRRDSRIRSVGVDANLQELSVCSALMLLSLSGWAAPLPW
jgi:hypothetical protein